MVARFKAETADYIQKIDQAKAKNRELATQLVETAGSAEKAMATLRVAKSKGAIGDLGLDPREVSGVIAQIRQLDRESRNAGSGAGEGFAKALGERAKELEQTFGEERAFNKLLQGGLIGFGVERIAEATKKAAELVDQFRQGKIEAGEMAEGIIASIPVLGKAWEIGRNIREIIGGENAAYERQAKLLEEIAAAHKEVQKAAAARREQASSGSQSTVDINADAAVKQLAANGFPGTAEYEEANSKALRDIRDFNKQVQKTFDEEIAKRQAEADQAAQRGHDLQAKNVADAQNPFSDNYGNAAALKAQAAKAQQFFDQQQNDLALIDSLTEQRDKLIRDHTDAINRALVQDFESKHGDLSPHEVDVQQQALAFGQQLYDGIVASLKGSPLAEWVKNQLDEGIKEMDRLRQKAEQIHESLKTPAQKLGDQLNEAQHARDAGVLSPADFSALLKKDADDLLREQKQIRSAERPVYELPQVSELRSGQALFVPPNRVDEEQLRRLEEIAASLAVIRDKAGEAGVTIEEISL